jgi:hypothetical protein
MSESDNKPPEQKPTPNQQAIEDLSWDFPGFRLVKNMLFREGRAIKDGWVAFILLCLVGFAVGYWSRGLEVDSLLTDNRGLDSAVATNQAAFNSERVENDKLNHQHNDDLQQINYLRQSVAGHFPAAITPAQLMGFHDETNFVVATNMIVTTVTVTNTMTFYASSPVLDFFQMESIKSKLDSATNLSVTVFYYQNDPDSIPLAKQVFQIFMASGFTINGPKPSPIRASAGIMVSSTSEAPKPIYDAMLALANDIGKSVIKDHEETNVMSNNDLWVFVSTK